MKILKQVLGVDVSQKELVVTLGRMTSDMVIELFSRSVFRNKETGFEALLKWVKKHADGSMAVHFAMEATGVYHEKFAYLLEEKGYPVSIILPSKISNYMRTLKIKTITDKTCADAIAQFGLERKLELWKQPNKNYRTIKQLTRERDQLVAERVMVKNQLHAEKTEAYPNESTLERLQTRIKFLSKQESEIKKEIDKVVSQNPDIKEEFTRLCTIPGIGKLTASIVLAETNGFELIRNKKQLTGYAGMDVIEKTSGTSVKGKTKISKKGNRYLRKALHLPSLSAVKHDENYKTIYARLVSKQGYKMKGLIAVQRKLLELCFILFKTKTVYNKNFQKEKEPKQVDSQELAHGCFISQM